MQQSNNDKSLGETLKGNVSIQKMFSKNYHSNRLDLNIQYNKKRAMKAKLIDGINKMIENQMKVN